MKKFLFLALATLSTVFQSSVFGHLDIIKHSLSATPAPTQPDPALKAIQDLLENWQDDNFWINRGKGTQGDLDAAKNSVKAAIEAGTFNDATIQDTFTKETALIIAARFNDLPMAQFLLEGTTNNTFKQSAQQSINTPSPNGVLDNGNQPNWTALNWAQQWNNPDMIALLKKYGATAN